MSLIRGSTSIQLSCRRLWTSDMSRSRSSVSSDVVLAVLRPLAPTGCVRCLSTVGSSDFTTLPVNLYQYKICPFSNIAKVVLTYQQIPFQSIEVNPLTKAQLKFSKDYRKVPIVQQQQQQQQQQPPQQFNGTEEILAHFAASNNNSNNAGHDFASSPSSQHWQDFACHKLAPLLYPNLCHTLANSFRAFDYVHAEPTFSTLQKYSIQYVGSVAMYLAAAKIKKKYGLEDVRVALEDALMELEQGLQESSSSSSSSSSTVMVFLNDSKSRNNNNNHNHEPHLGDLAVFGVLKGLEGLPILENDILQDERFPRIQQWYAAMNDQVERKKICGT